MPGEAAVRPPVAVPAALGVPEQVAGALREAVAVPRERLGRLRVAEESRDPGQRLRVGDVQRVEPGVGQVHGVRGLVEHRVVVHRRVVQPGLSARPVDRGRPRVAFDRVGPPGQQPVRAAPGGRPPGVPVTQHRVRPLEQLAAAGLAGQAAAEVGLQHGVGAHRGLGTVVGAPEVVADAVRQHAVRARLVQDLREDPLGVGGIGPRGDEPGEERVPRVQRPPAVEPLPRAADEVPRGRCEHPAEVGGEDGVPGQRPGHGVAGVPQPAGGAQAGGVGLRHRPADPGAYAPGGARPAQADLGGVAAEHQPLGEHAGRGRALQQPDAAAVLHDDALARLLADGDGGAAEPRGLVEEEDEFRRARAPVREDVQLVVAAARLQTQLGAVGVDGDGAVPAVRRVVAEPDQAAAPGERVEDLSPRGAEREPGAQAGGQVHPGGVVLDVPGVPPPRLGNGGGHQPSAPSMSRAASSSSLVYGCRGSANSVSVSPVSTSSPRRMTATRWAICRTTPRSWVMNRMDRS